MSQIPLQSWIVRNTFYNPFQISWSCAWLIRNGYAYATTAPKKKQRIKPILLVAKKSREWISWKRVFSMYVVNAQLDPLHETALHFNVDYEYFRNERFLIESDIQISIGLTFFNLIIAIKSKLQLKIAHPEFIDWLMQCFIHWFARIQ